MEFSNSFRAAAKRAHRGDQKLMQFIESGKEHLVQLYLRSHTPVLKASTVNNLLKQRRLGELKTRANQAAARQNLLHRFLKGGAAVFRQADTAN